MAATRQMPAPSVDIRGQIPHYAELKSIKCPRYAREGGGGMGTLGFDSYIMLSKHFFVGTQFFSFQHKVKFKNFTAKLGVRRLK